MKERGFIGHGVCYGLLRVDVSLRAIDYTNDAQFHRDNPVHQEIVCVCSMVHEVQFRQDTESSFAWGRPIKKHMRHTFKCNLVGNHKFVVTPIRSHYDDLTGHTHQCMCATHTTSYRTPQFFLLFRLPSNTSEDTLLSLKGYYFTFGA